MVPAQSLVPGRYYIDLSESRCRVEFFGEFLRIEFLRRALFDGGEHGVGKTFCVRVLRGQFHVGEQVLGQQRVDGRVEFCRREKHDCTRLPNPAPTRSLTHPELQRIWGGSRSRLLRQILVLVPEGTISRPSKSAPSLPGVLWWRRRRCRQRRSLRQVSRGSSEFCALICAGFGSRLCPILRQPRSIHCCAFKIRFGSHRPGPIPGMIAAWHDACCENPGAPPPAPCLSPG